MLIQDIISENYQTDLLTAVQDQLAMIMTQDIKEIPTQEFQQRLAKQGYISSIEEIITAVDQSGYASSVNKEKIVPKNGLPADIETDSEPSVNVSKMAGDQALSDIKSEL